MVFSFAGFCTGVSAAIVVKLTSSIDDVLWLSVFFTPKLSHRQRTQNALTYACICLLQTCLAFFISTFGQEVMESLLGKNEDLMSTDRILTLISGSALFVYSIVLAKEYHHENYGGENGVEYSMVDNTSRVTGSSADKSGYRKEEPKEDGPDVKPNPQDVELGNRVLPLEIEDGTDSDSSDSLNDSSSDKDMKEQVEDESPRSDKESRSLAVIAFLGSLDDLALFVPMLVGKTFGIVALIIGAMISALAILFICLFLTKCKLVADTLEKIPLVAIVTGFCVVLLVKGIFFMD
jgi:cadmium resistance protein CadD (predicted permease)